MFRYFILLESEIVVELLSLIALTKKKIHATPGTVTLIFSNSSTVAAFMALRNLVFVAMFLRFFIRFDMDFLAKAVSNNRILGDFSVKSSEQNRK